MFISILYVFQAAMCPSSGELLYQCDTWFMSLCVDDRLVCIPNIQKKIVYQVGYLQVSYQDARSTKQNGVKPSSLIHLFLPF